MRAILFSLLSTLINITRTFLGITIVPQPKSYLPFNAFTTIFNDPNGIESIEIAVIIDNEYIDLAYPRLLGTFKVVNETWSVSFVIDFLLLEKSDGDYAFEAETRVINRNQFKNKESMMQRLEQIYATYYDKVQNFDATGDVIAQVKECFTDTISKLNVLDTDMVIYLGKH